MSNCNILKAKILPDILKNNLKHIFKLMLTNQLNLATIQTKVIYPLVQSIQLTAITLSIHCQII